jgi:hypothetical protein
MDKLMDSDDETMFSALTEEEAEITTADDEEHLMMLSCLMALYARNDAKPRRGGLAPGRRKNKPRQRLEGYCILYADYFADDPLHGEVVFRRHFRMSQKLFLDIVYSVRRFDNYFICKKNCTDIVAYSSLQCIRRTELLFDEAQKVNSMGVVPIRILSKEPRTK